MKVKKQTLLVIASIVWMAAGFNIVRIGLITYVNHITVLNILLSIGVFLIFWFLIFNKLVVKHTNRIINYEEKYQLFYKFFDLKSFLIMAFMMTFGILIRTFNLAPESFIAFFYTGLGAALFLAGILFGVSAWKYREALA